MKSISNGLFLLLVTLAAGCADPVHSEGLTGLGDEDPNVPAGPLHRPGQRCTGACHDGQGPGGWVFSMAGTIYQYQDQPQPLAGAIVHVVDSLKNTYSTETNCAGNFFIQSADFTPVYPAWVYLEQGGSNIPMNSAIYREGACAGCHALEFSRSSAGKVYFSAGLPVTNGSCQ